MEDNTHEIEFLEDKEEGAYGTEDFASHSAVEGFVMDRFERARADRYSQEQRWLEAHLNYRGEPHPSLQYREVEENDFFLKITKTKTLAAYGIIHEILFPNNGNAFPLMVTPTPVPEGVEHAVHIDPKAPPENTDASPASPYGYPGDGKDLEPGANFDLGPLKEKFKGLMGKVKSGAGGTPSSVNMYPAIEAAEHMDRKMQDQFAEGNAHESLKRAIFDSVLYGTGVMKGPFAVEREYPYWESPEEEGGKARYKPVKKMVPSFEHVSIWDFYADPEAYGDGDMEYCIIKRRMSASNLRSLKKRAMFRKNAVEDAIEAGPSHNDEWWNQNIEDDEHASPNERYQVLEYWGIIGRDVLEEDSDVFADITIPEEMDDYDEFSVSIWICNGEVLKFSFNPYRPQRMPFHVFRYEYNPSNFYGVGLAENMSDTQLLMNGFARMAIDNANKSGDIVVEIDEDALVPGQDLTLEPGKVFRRQSGAVGQAITAIKWQNTTQENMMMFDKMRQLADESTGFPSFAHGQTGVSGVGRTASGISMLMGAASTNIKTIIKNYDNTLEHIGAALYEYNMLFDYDEKGVGDIVVTARGTDALLTNEIRSQRLAMFMQQAANPIMAPHVKWPYLLREIAKSMDLDTEKLLNSPEETMLQALQMQQMNPQGPQGGGGPQGPQAPGTSPADTQGGGGGVPGVGMPQQPGMPGFTGNPQQQGPAQQ